MREQQEEEFRFFKLDKYHKDRWDDFVYNKARAEKYFSVIRRNGGYIPSVRELAPSKKQELFSKAKDYFWCISVSMNMLTRGQTPCEVDTHAHNTPSMNASLRFSSDKVSSCEVDTVEDNVLKTSFPFGLPYKRHRRPQDSIDVIVDPPCPRKDWLSRGQRYE